MKKVPPFNVFVDIRSNWKNCLPSIFIKDSDSESGKSQIRTHLSDPYICNSRCSHGWTNRMLTNDFLISILKEDYTSIKYLMICIFYVSEPYRIVWSVNTFACVALSSYMLCSYCFILNIYWSSSFCYWSLHCMRRSDRRLYIYIYELCVTIYRLCCKRAYKHNLYIYIYSDIQCHATRVML